MINNIDISPTRKKLETALNSTQSHRRPFRTFCILLATLLTLNATNAWIWPLDIQSSGVTEKLAGFQYQILTLFLFVLGTVFLFLKNYKVYKVDILVFIIAILLLLSTFLNAREFFEYSRIVFTIGFLLSCMFLRNLDRKLYLEIIIWIFVLIILGSILAVLFGFGTMAGVHEGKWRGLFEHKNRFGHFSAVTVFLILYLYSSGKLSTLYSMLMGTLTIICLYNSDSATALVGLLASFLILRLVDVFRFKEFNSYTRTGVAVVFILFAVFLGSITFDYIVGLFGRDSDLSGRSRVWEVFLGFANQKPILGWGVSTEIYNEVVIPAARQLLWSTIGSTHSSYVQIILEGGYASFGVFCAYISIVTLTVVRKFLISRNPETTLMLHLTVFFIFTMYTESINGFGIGLTMLFFMFSHGYTVEKQEKDELS